MDRSYYFGSTKNIENRMQQHNQGRSKATASRKPWVLLKAIQFPTIEKARSIEQKMKSHKVKITEEWFDECIKHYISND